MPTCKITVLKKSYTPALAEQYLANPQVGPCAVFEEGQEILIDKNAYFSMQIPSGFCAEAWHAVAHYVYAALQGGAIMDGWTNDPKVMIACCNDGVRPVIFKIERIDD